MSKSLLFLLGLFPFVMANAQAKTGLTYSYGAIIRGDTTKKELALIFTADEFAEGLLTITKALKKQKVKAAFFFTGRFYRHKNFHSSIEQIKRDGHYLGPHSDQHLLYCDWKKRDSLLVTKDSFITDITQNITTMKAHGLAVLPHHYFIPPFEWWNDSISIWSKAQSLKLFSFTPGIRTNADYTWPQMGDRYKSSEWIMNWIREYMTTDPGKLNGSIILIHAGTDPRRKDRLYNRMNELIEYLKLKGYRLKRVDELLGN